MKKLVSLIMTFVLFIFAIMIFDSAITLNAAIIIFSASSILFFCDNNYSLNEVFIALGVCISVTIFVMGENLNFIAINCLLVLIFLRIGGEASFNSCDVFFAFLKRRKLFSQILEFDSCNECYFHNIKHESGDCKLFGLIPSGIKWSQKTCYHCQSFQQGELTFLGLKTNYSSYLGFYKKK